MYVSNLLNYSCKVWKNYFGVYAAQWNYLLGTFKEDILESFFFHILGCFSKSIYSQANVIECTDIFILKPSFHHRISFRNYTFPSIILYAHFVYPFYVFYLFKWNMKNRKCHLITPVSQIFWGVVASYLFGEKMVVQNLLCFVSVAFIKIDSSLYRCTEAWQL